MFLHSLRVELEHWNLTLQLEFTSDGRIRGSVENTVEDHHRKPGLHGLCCAVMGRNTNAVLNSGVVMYRAAPFVSFEQGAEGGCLIW